MADPYIESGSRVISLDDVTKIRVSTGSGMESFPIPLGDAQDNTGSFIIDLGGQTKEITLNINKRGSPTELNNWIDQVELMLSDQREEELKTGNFPYGVLNLGWGDVVISKFDWEVDEDKGASEEKNELDVTMTLAVGFVMNLGDW